MPARSIRAIPRSFGLLMQQKEVVLSLETRHVDRLVIQGARLIDPALGLDGIGDLCVRNGRIVKQITGPSVVLRAEGLIVCPGFLDPHVHLREPGHEHKGTIATETRAAAAGGFVAVACMPNTSPPLDEPDRIRFVLERSRAGGSAEVYPIACITRGRRGEELADLSALKEAGAAGFSDDGDGVEQDEVMAAAFEAAARLGVPLIQHCEYRALSAGGVMHLGEMSRRLGLPGLDPKSEEAMIERDISLCRRIGGRYHVAHISTARAVEWVRKAKRERLPVTAEVCPHHLLLTDEACGDRDPNTKMHPPLRGREDVAACRAGLLDGAIDCLATDHAPHAAEEKARGFLKAPPGIVGLETAVGLMAELFLHECGLDWPRLVEWFSLAPRRVLGLDAVTLAPGGPARLTIINPNAREAVDPGRFESRCRNTPFGGWATAGCATATLIGNLLHTREIDRLRREPT